MTLISVDDSTFVEDVVFILGSHQEVFDGESSFQMHMDSIFLASSFETFTKSWWYGSTMFGFGLLGCVGFELSVLLLVLWLDVS